MARIVTSTYWPKQAPRKKRKQPPAVIDFLQTHPTVLRPFSNT